MKKKGLLLGISAAALLGITSMGLVSCGETVVSADENAPVLTSVSGNALTLASSLVVESKDSTYFTPCIVKTEDGAQKYVSSGGKALITSGQSVSLLAYGVPSGYSLYADVLDSTGAASSGLTVGADGSIVAPSVNELTKFYVMLYAESPDATYEYGGKMYKDIIRKSVEVDVIPASQLASNDVFTYSLGAEENTKAAATLEKYAMENALTGVTLNNNGGYNLYNDRVSAPLLDSDSYLPGYGFGVNMYGKITKDLDAEQTSEFKRFFHDQIGPSQDPGIINYLNSDQATVSDLYGYVSGSYFTTPLNKDYSGYEYRGNLSRVDAPIPLNMGEDGTATKWKILLRVGADKDGDNGLTNGLTFRTATKDSTLSKYDNRKIELSDYLTPFKLLSSQAIGWYRGSEQAAEKTASRQIKGFAEYYNKTKDQTSLPSDAEFSKQVGVSIDSSDNSLTIEFNAGFTMDYAIYQIDGLWSNPICEDFVSDLGGGDIMKGAQLYGTSPSGKTPLDTFLSVGPYYTYYYESKKTIAFKKNDNWFMKKDSFDRSIYQLEGFHLNVNSAIDTNSENAYIEAFEAGKIDYSNIPEASWDKYATDPRKKKVYGSRTFKITFNACDKPLWEYYFGKGGMWHDKFNANDTYSWETKPISSNRNFYYGLNLAVDRVAYAEKYHTVPSIDYANPINKVNPVTTELYNSSEAHKAALSSIYGSGFDDISKSMAYSVSYLDAGIQQELESGHYKLGTGENPTVIEMDCGTIDDGRQDRLAIIGQNWTDMVKTAVLSHVDENGNNNWVDSKGNAKIIFKLGIEAVPSDSSMKDLITGGLWAGRWDCQFGYLITGNAYDTLNGLDILMSNKMGGFELNFGVDTSIPSSTIYYDGKYWSFEGLWQATQGGVVLDENGTAASSLLEPDDTTAKLTENADGSYTITFSVIKTEGFDIEVSTEDSVYLNSTATKYLSGSQIINNADGTVSFVIPSDGLVPGSVIGQADTAKYFEGVFYYVVTGASGKKATYSCTWGWLF